MLFWMHLLYKKPSTSRVSHKHVTVVYTFMEIHEEDILWEKKATQKRIPLKIDALASAHGTGTNFPAAHFPLSAVQIEAAAQKKKLECSVARCSACRVRNAER